MFNEKEVIEGCCKGDRKSQRELYEQFSRGMLVVCLRYCKNQLEAEDILQESFIKVFENIKKFRRESSLAYWIKRIIVNTALNHQRGKLYLFPMVDIEQTNEVSDKDLTISGFQFEELLEMIMELPTGCQVIFNLYAIEGYKHHEIAKKLEISEGTSKSQYSRARKLLMERIQSQEKNSYEKFR